MARTSKEDSTNYTTDEVEETATVTATPPPAVIETPPIPPPTIDDAFWVLTDALLARLDENQPERLHCEQIRMWKMDGNWQVSWQHTVMLLEGVLGIRLARP